MKLVVERKQQVQTLLAPFSPSLLVVEQWIFFSQVPRLTLLSVGRGTWLEVPWYLMAFSMCFLRTLSWPGTYPRSSHYCAESWPPVGAVFGHVIVLVTRSSFLGRFCNRGGKYFPFADSLCITGRWFIFSRKAIQRLLLNGKYCLLQELLEQSGWSLNRRSPVCTWSQCTPQTHHVGSIFQILFNTKFFEQSDHKLC